MPFSYANNKWSLIGFHLRWAVLSRTGQGQNWGCKFMPHIGHIYEPCSLYLVIKLCYKSNNMFFLLKIHLIYDKLKISKIWGTAYRNAIMVLQSNKCGNCQNVHIPAASLIISILYYLGVLLEMDSKCLAINDTFVEPVNHSRQPVVNNSHFCVQIYLFFKHNFL